jgi:hypothetical protein
MRQVRSTPINQETKILEQNKDQRKKKERRSSETCRAQTKCGDCMLDSDGSQSHASAVLNFGTERGNAFDITAKNASLDDTEFEDGNGRLFDSV